jgi:hypothetical protein
VLARSIQGITGIVGAGIVIVTIDWQTWTTSIVIGKGFLAQVQTNF